jgi:hypothetical protein
MKIVQLVTHNEALYGLDDSGVLWEFQNHKNASAAIKDKEAKTNMFMSGVDYCYTSEKRYAETVQSALKNPERFETTFISGHTAGWLEVCGPIPSTPLYDPRDPNKP